ncbi:ankyrin repeat-containing domain protein [Nitzschia inconspicua]|uniref:Ankyrin repeat-containing domain protein n=1 Tax=Nitzschia inconspicua TaxID=303405 RepID=A0A9K3Q0F5_9STRA|nr:ankyrin repeat-containing domain protein [Nitzschia inconspicua]
MTEDKKQTTKITLETSRDQCFKDVPHKRSNSKVMTSVLHGVKQPLSGSTFFEAMARYKQQESISEEKPVTRRRRLSLKSACSSTVETSACTESSSSKDEVTSDTRSDLPVEDDVPNLPDHTIHESPEIYLQKLVKVTCYGLELEIKKARSLEDFFAKVTDAQIEAYTTAVVTVVRNNDLAGLKELHAKGQALNCFNRFGESLLHMACRRGFEEIVDFLLEQPEVDIRVSDDNGRTILHDACWNPSPQLKICQRILERDPTLLFIADNRGCSAFQYARPEHWTIWRKFLLENRSLLSALKQPSIQKQFAKAT